jgi:hypothetical protein
MRSRPGGSSSRNTGRVAGSMRDTKRGSRFYWTEARYNGNSTQKSTEVSSRWKRGTVIKRHNGGSYPDANIR